MQAVIEHCSQLQISIQRVDSVNLHPKQRIRYQSSATQFSEKNHSRLFTYGLICQVHQQTSKDLNPLTKSIMKPNHTGSQYPETVPDPYSLLHTSYTGKDTLPGPLWQSTSRDWFVTNTGQ